MKEKKNHNGELTLGKMLEVLILWNPRTREPLLHLSQLTISLIEND